MSSTEDVVEDESAKRRRFRRADFLGNTDVYAPIIKRSGFPVSIVARMFRSVLIETAIITHANIVKHMRTQSILTGIEHGGTGEVSTRGYTL